MERALLKSTFVRSLLTTLLLWTFLPAEAYNGEDFTYEGINYTVISETQKTCQTKEGSSWAHPGSNCSGDIILPTNPNGYKLTAIGSYSFSSCSSLTSVIIPEGVTTIKSEAFAFCEALKTVYIPNSVSSIGKCAFNTCINLTSVSIPEGVEYIYDRTFRNCSSLTSILIPQSVYCIEDYAFSGCTSLTSLTIPASVRSFGMSIVDGCRLNPLIFAGLYTYSPNPRLLSGFKGGTIYCQENSVDALKASGYSSVYPANKYSIAITPLTFGCELTVTERSYSLVENKDYQIQIQTPSRDIVKTLDINKEGKYIIKDLEPNTKYRLYAWCEENGITWEYNTVFHTNNCEFNVTAYCTQTSIVPDIEIIPDATFEVIEFTEKGFYYNNDKYICIDGKQNIIRDLYPDQTITITPYGIYNDVEYKSNSVKLSSKGWGSPSASKGPTTIELLGNLIEEDAHPDAVWWTGDNIQGSIQGTNVSLLSLSPNTTYNAIFHIRYTPEGKPNKVYDYPLEFKTKELELKTLQPKCVSESCAIVAASTNMSDDEVGAGFEWKKYDAPASLTPSSGSAVVCDGMLEGYIRNLQPTSYYNVRAYYKNAAGKYWYGDWVTFDPSDFSYFEPTVRTYPAEDITSSSAKVRGYALPGTDPFHSQGFQYWKTGSSSSRKIKSAESEITTVIATGQIMTATFDGLEPDTQYSFRVFVETEQGFTYGDEQTFTTETDTGVDTINDSFNETNIIGYYNLMGVRSDRPHKGINIVVYSNGKTKKTRY